MISGAQHLVLLNEFNRSLGAGTALSQRRQQLPAALQCAQGRGQGGTVPYQPKEGPGPRPWEEPFLKAWGAFRSQLCRSSRAVGKRWNTQDPKITALTDLATTTCLRPPWSPTDCSDVGGTQGSAHLFLVAAPISPSLLPGKFSPTASLCPKQ